MSVATIEAAAFALNCACRALRGVAAARAAAPLVHDTNVDADSEAIAAYHIDVSTND